MNIDFDTLSCDSDIWTITLPEEAVSKFKDLKSKVSLASSKEDSIRLMIETLKFFLNPPRTGRCFFPHSAGSKLGGVDGGDAYIMCYK